MNVTGWSRGLEVTAGGQGIVSHAGLVLLRQLADRTGLTAGLSKALASRRLLVHDRGRVLADLACAVADGAEVISDFRVMADQQELFGLVASVPTCWRALSEIAAGDSRPLARITAAVNAARRQAWAGIVARHGGLPGVAMADRVLEGVTCIRLDATVTPAHSDKELAEPNYKGFGHRPLLAYCDNSGEPVAGMLRCGSAGSNTVVDHLEVLEAAIAALPSAFRRRLMVTCDGAGASHGLIARLDALAGRPGHQLIYSVGWDLGERERTAIHLVPGQAWQIALDHCGEVRERRVLTCFWQAVLGLRWFRDRTTAEALAPDYGISRATAYRYLDEVIAVLADQAPDLRAALERASGEGLSHVILDGKVIPCDRCKQPALSVKGEVIDLWFSGKVHTHGGSGRERDSLVQLPGVSTGPLWWVGELIAWAVCGPSQAQIGPTTVNHRKWRLCSSAAVLTR